MCDASSISNGVDASVERRLQSSLATKHGILQLEIALMQKQHECNLFANQVQELRSSIADLKDQLLSSQGRYRSVLLLAEQLRNDKNWLSSTMQQLQELMQRFVSYIVGILQEQCIVRCAGVDGSCIDLGSPDGPFPGAKQSESPSTMQYWNAQFAEAVRTLQLQNERLRQEHQHMKANGNAAAAMIQHLSDRLEALEVQSGKDANCSSPQSPPSAADLPQAYTAFADRELLQALELQSTPASAQRSTAPVDTELVEGLGSTQCAAHSEQCRIGSVTAVQLKHAPEQRADTVPTSTACVREEVGDGPHTTHLTRHDGQVSSRGAIGREIQETIRAAEEVLQMDVAFRDLNGSGSHDKAESPRRAPTSFVRTARPSRARDRRLLDAGAAQWSGSARMRSTSERAPAASERKPHERGPARGSGSARVRSGSEKSCLKHHVDNGLKIGRIGGVEGGRWVGGVPSRSMSPGIVVCHPSQPLINQLQNGVKERHRNVLW